MRLRNLGGSSIWIERLPIKAWKQASQAKYQYSIEPLSSSQEGQTVTLLARLSGNFPGSPVELTYTFVLDNGKIASLEIS